ncbi:hypothetical protein Hanom_Chr12g01117141 [Helianthus anomalus]
MKVKTGSEPVPGTSNVSTELVLRIFRFREFGSGTQYYLLITNYGFLPNNIITIQLFYLILFLLFLVFFYIYLLIFSAIPCATRSW